MIFRTFDSSYCLVETTIRSDRKFRPAEALQKHLHISYRRENVLDKDYIVPVLNLVFSIPSWTTIPTNGCISNDHRIVVNVERNSIIINDNEYDILKLSLFRGAIDIRKIMPYTGITFKF